MTDIIGCTSYRQTTPSRTYALGLGTALVGELRKLPLLSHIGSMTAGAGGEPNQARL